MTPDECTNKVGAYRYNNVKEAHNNCGGDCCKEFTTTDHSCPQICREACENGDIEFENGNGVDISNCGSNHIDGSCHEKYLPECFRAFMGFCQCYFYTTNEDFTRTSTPLVPNENIIH